MLSLYKGRVRSLRPPRKILGCRPRLAHDPYEVQAARCVYATLKEISSAALRSRSER
jgi:hypothetical protein